MSLTDKQKIRLCKKIIHSPNLLGSTNIKGYDPQDLAEFISYLGDKNGNQLSIGIVEDYKRELENHAHSISYKRDIVSGIIGGIIGITLSNLDRIIRFFVSLFNKS